MMDTLRDQPLIPACHDYSLRVTMKQSRKYPGPRIALCGMIRAQSEVKAQNPKG